jgi:hypothetical protein
MHTHIAFALGFLLVGNAALSSAVAQQFQTSTWQVGTLAGFRETRTHLTGRSA